MLLAYANETDSDDNTTTSGSWYMVEKSIIVVGGTAKDTLKIMTEVIFV